MSIKKAIIKMAENINIEDNRQQGKVKYPLIPTIITIFLAWCAGCNNCREIAEFWEYKKKELKKLVPDFPKDNISHDTVNREPLGISMGKNHSLCSFYPYLS